MIEIRGLRTRESATPEHEPEGVHAQACDCRVCIYLGRGQRQHLRSTTPPWPATCTMVRGRMPRALSVPSQCALARPPASHQSTSQRGCPSVTYGTLVHTTTRRPAIVVCAFACAQGQMSQEYNREIAVNPGHRQFFPTFDWDRELTSFPSGQKRRLRGARQN